MGISKVFSDIIGIKRTNDNIQAPSNGDFSHSAMNNVQQPYNMDQNLMYQQQLMNQQSQIQQPQMSQPYLGQPSYQPTNQQFVPQPQIQPQQSTMDYQKRIIEEKNSGYLPEQPLYTPRPQHVASRRHQSVPVNFENGRQQQALDFSRPQPVEYGNYQEPQELERINRDLHYYEQVRQNQVPSSVPVQQQFSQMGQMPSGQYQYARQPQQQIDYHEYYDEPMMDYNNPQPQMYYPAMESQLQIGAKQEVRRSVNILPTQIAREVRSEKLRVAILMIIGFAGIVLTSILLAGYYKMVKLDATAIKTASFAGFSFQQTPYPFISIIFLIVSAFLFFLGVTDYSLLYANVKKYERDLISGKEQVPYFITRNYRNILSRGVYVTWLCFATYIIGAISLGILYGLQGLYDSGSREFYILFWRVGSLKSFKSDITINIIVLIATLVAHITNIVWSRSRKNNVIAYYGAPIVSSEEERQIKKHANKICIIVTCVVLAVVLFAVAIPWAILRRRRGKSIIPFGRANN